MAFHKDSTLTDNHAIQAYMYADAATRNAATGFVAGDIGKVACQLDTGRFYVLVDESPVTWSQLSNGGGGTVSTALGGCAVDGNATVTTVTTQDVWVDVNLGTSVIFAESVDVSLLDATGGELKYIGDDDTIFTLHASLSLGALSPSKDFEFRLCQNGSPLTPAVVALVTSLAGSPTRVSLQGIATLVTDDTIQVQLRETDGTTDPTITDFQLVIRA
jgi:hypothetical protein